MHDFAAVMHFMKLPEQWNFVLKIETPLKTPNPSAVVPSPAKINRPVKL